MIDYNGKFNNLPFSNASMYSLVDYSNDIKNNILKSFFEKLGLDPSLFEHLYDIDILIDNSKNEDDYLCAYYVDNNEATGEPAIYITTQFLISQLSKIEKDEANREEYIKQVVITLIHETIHSNRSIIVKNSINASDTIKECYKDNEYLKKIYADYEELLSQKYNGKDITILKVLASYSDYEVIVYNRKLDRYECYYLDYDYIDNSSKTLFDDIREIIEYNINDLKPDYVLNRINKDAKPDILSNMDTHSEYSLPLSSMEELVEGEKISSQIGLEESLTECMALIIYESSKYDTFDKDLICNSIEKQIQTQDVRLANEIFKQMDEGSIKWFILSCYGDEYTNRIEEFYDELYPKMVRMFDAIFNSYQKYKEPDDTLCFDTLKLIKKNNR